MSEGRPATELCHPTPQGPHTCCPSLSSLSSTHPPAEVVDQRLDCHAQVPKVGIHVGRKERVARGRKHGLGSLQLDPGDVPQVDPVVLQAQQLVHHRLVRPLQEDGRKRGLGGCTAGRLAVVLQAPAARADARPRASAVERAHAGRRPVCLTTHPYIHPIQPSIHAFVLLPRLNPCICPLRRRLARAALPYSTTYPQARE